MIDLSYKPQLITRMYTIMEDTRQCTIHTIHFTMYIIQDKKVSHFYIRNTVGQLSITSAFLVPTEICPYCFCFEIFLLVCKSAVFPPGYCICCLIQFAPASRCRLLAGPGIQGTGKHKKALGQYTSLCFVHTQYFNLICTTLRHGLIMLLEKTKKGDHAAALQCLLHT